jgi:transposase
LRPATELDADEQAYRQALCQEHAPLATAQALAEDFVRIMRARGSTALDRWLADAVRSRIGELVSFARGLRRDHEAVVAALHSAYSQGQTEGQINRLKMLKRQTYGRANFDLLRRRVLYHAA